jgi:NAD(P)-dependent dehydrogenase (short-subunit alcohol dehydrogenase family)
VRGLAGRRVLITGGGGAIGRASSLRFAAEGARVAVADVSAAAADETVRLVRERGGEAIAVVADVREEDAVQGAVADVVQAFGGLDVLFNNAGIMPTDDVSFADGDLQLWRTINDTNLNGTMLCSKHAVPHLVAAGGGAVVNMSSFLIAMGCSIPQDAYAASKGAIAALTTSMAVQLGPKGIRVNALAPGPVLTPQVSTFLADPADRQLRLDRIPLGRFGQPEDAAGLACFLASDDASWLAGQTIVLDGGISSYYL